MKREVKFSKWETIIKNCDHATFSAFAQVLYF